MFEAAEATAAAAATAALRSLFMLDSKALRSSLSRRPSRFSVYLLLRLQYALFIRRRINFSLSSGPRLVSAAKYSMRINLSRRRARSEAKAAEALPISPSSPAHVRQQPHSEQPESPEPHPQSIP